MERRCLRENCFAPETACDHGEVSLADCPFWNEQGSDGPSPGEVADEDAALLPWTGAALGLAHIAFVAGRAKPMTVGVIGPYNAGKTTLLAAWYLLLSRGKKASGTPGFAGSYSLMGWEAVAGAMRWGPGPTPPTFPPHTSSRGGRAPGLLHLAFRYAGGRAKSWLFSDAPGEWFEKWATNRDSDEAEGARWVAEHADVFLLVADREALAGDAKGAARNALRLLAQRLAAERGRRPVALVWTKADVAITPATESAVREAVSRNMPDVREFSVSVTPATDDDGDNGSGFLELLDWMLNQRRERITLPQGEARGDDPLFLYGARAS